MITRIGQGSAEATTVTIPAGHQAGDLLIIFAFRDGSIGNPAIPAGWQNITNTFDGTTCSVSVGWKIAANDSQTSGTWTNATGLMVVVLRGADTDAPIMTNATSAGTTNTVTFAALTDANLKGVARYYIFAFLAHRSVDTNIDVAPPNGMINFLSALGATQDMCAHEASSGHMWASTNTTITGTESGWQSMVLAIRNARMITNNYMQGSAMVGNDGIVSVTEKIR